MTRVLLAALLLGVASVATAAPAGAEVQPDLTDDRERLSTQLDVLEALLDNGMAEQALAMIGEMGKQGAVDVRIDVAKGRAMHQRGLDHDAERVLRAVVKKYPRNAPAWAQLGILLADTGKVPEAVTALEKAARLAPKDGDVANNLGYVRLAAGDAEGAVTAFHQALELDPASVRTRNNLGLALVRLDRHDEALEAFRAAAVDEADARYNLGVACEGAGDRAGALTAYQTATSLRPGHPAAVAALSRLLKEPSP